MSVASLNDGHLQLSELVISNSKYSNASGYVASSSTFSSGVTNTSLNTNSLNTNQLVLTQSGTSNVTASCIADGVFDVNGTVSSEAIACNGNLTLFNAAVSTNNVTVSCEADNTLNLFQNDTVSNNVGIQCIGSGILNVIGTLSANTLAGNGSLTLYNATTSSNSVTMDCTTNGVLNIYDGNTTTNSVGLQCYQNITGNLQVGSLSAPATSTVAVSAIQFINGSASGILSINSSSQLTFNGIVIS